jgi:hypothetical protein
VIEEVVVVFHLHFLLCVASVFSARTSYLLPKGGAHSDGPFQASSWIRVLCHV